MSDVDYLTIVFKEDINYTLGLASTISMMFQRDWDEHIEINVNTKLSDRSSEGFIVWDTTATTSQASTPEKSTFLSSSV